MDALDALRHYARLRKIQAISDALLPTYDWNTKEPCKQMGYAIERQRMAYSRFPAASVYTRLELLKENDEKKRHA